MAEDQTLFSAVDGTVTENGTPVAGVLIKQSAQLGAGKPQTQETTTDENGAFRLSQLTRASGLGGLLPQQFAVGQEIIIHHNGEEYIGWIATKFDPEAGSETGTDPIALVCELTADPAGGENHVGVCRVRE